MLVVKHYFAPFLFHFFYFFSISYIPSNVISMQVADADHIDRLISCLFMAIPFVVVCTFVTLYVSE